MSLTTNLHLGKHLLKDTGDWAFLTTSPKLGKAENHQVCPILFDIGNKKIIIDKENVKLYDEENANEIYFRYINPEKWGRHGKKFALTAEPRKFKMLIETLFGKKQGDKGSGQTSLEEYKGYDNSELYLALSLVNENFKETDISEKGILKDLNFGKNDDVALFYVVIKSEKIRDGKPTPLFYLDGFEKFVFEKFGPKQGYEGLDYLTGLKGNNVDEAGFERGKNLNAIFQTTSSNYASDFSDFSKNFKTNSKSALALDKASKYYLNNLSTKIAEISHLIIPHYRHCELENINWDDEQIYLKKTSDFLFQYKPVNERFRNDEHNLFWVNYIAYESDGNSFKIINQIKDVSNKWLEKVIYSFLETGVEFDQYIGDKSYFNLQSIYNIVPVKKVSKNQKDPLNQALFIFKDILEQRKINKNHLFSIFKDLILCHYYGRYKKYKNLKAEYFSSFDYAAKDAVFKYQLLFKTLQNLNLLNMETTEKRETKPESKNSLQVAVEKFFKEMGYTKEQEALFYLGRVASQVGDAKYRNKHKNKPILKKINFNGMDANALMRLANDLSEKAVQYSIHQQTDWNLSHFNESFKKEKWSLDRDENIFYLMAGYTFKLTQKDSEES